MPSNTLPGTTGSPFILSKGLFLKDVTLIVEKVADLVQTIKDQHVKGGLFREHREPQGAEGNHRGRPVRKSAGKALCRRIGPRRRLDDRRDVSPQRDGKPSWRALKINRMLGSPILRAIIVMAVMLFIQIVRSGG